MALTDRCPRFGLHYLWLCRLFGTASAITLWGIGSEALCFRYVLIGTLLVLAALLVTILEGSFLITDLLVACKADPRHVCIAHGWDYVTAVDNYRRALLYILLSVPCYVTAHETWLPIISGCLLNVTSVLYLLKPCFPQPCATVERITTFRKFDDDLQKDSVTAISIEGASSSGGSEGSSPLGSKDSGIEYKPKNDIKNACAKSETSSRASRKSTSKSDRLILIDHDDLSCE